MDENTPPFGYRHLSDVEVTKCLTLDKSGWSQRAIAEEVKCSQLTINRLLKEYNYETFSQRNQHSGSARKMITEDDKHLIIIVKCHYNLSFYNITNLFDLSISKRIVEHRCKEVEFINHYA